MKNSIERTLELLSEGFGRMVQKKAEDASRSQEAVKAVAKEMDKVTDEAIFNLISEKFTDPGMHWHHFKIIDFFNACVPGYKRTYYPALLFCKTAQPDKIVLELPTGWISGGGPGGRETHMAISVKNEDRDGMTVDSAGTKRYQFNNSAKNRSSFVLYDRFDDHTGTPGWKEKPSDNLEMKYIVKAIVKLANSPKGIKCREAIMKQLGYDVSYEDYVKPKDREGYVAPKDREGYVDPKTIEAKEGKGIPVIDEDGAERWVHKSNSSVINKFFEALKEQWPRPTIMIPRSIKAIDEVVKQEGGEIKVWLSGIKKKPVHYEKKLDGMTICFTGKFDDFEGGYFGKGDAVEEVMTSVYGANCVHAVNKKLNLLVTGAKPGQAKVDKAKELGIETLTFRSFMKKYGIKDRFDMNSEAGKLQYKILVFGTKTDNEDQYMLVAREKKADYMRDSRGDIMRFNSYGYSVSKYAGGYWNSKINPEWKNASPKKTPAQWKVYIGSYYSIYRSWNSEPVMVFDKK